MSLKQMEQKKMNMKHKGKDSYNIDHESSYMTWQTHFIHKLREPRKEHFKV